MPASAPASANVRRRNRDHGSSRVMASVVAKGFEGADARRPASRKIGRGETDGRRAGSQSTAHARSDRPACTSCSEPAQRSCGSAIASSRPAPTPAATTPRRRASPAAAPGRASRRAPRGRRSPRPPRPRSTRSRRRRRSAASTSAAQRERAEHDRDEPGTGHERRDFVVERAHRVRWARHDRATTRAPRIAGASASGFPTANDARSSSTSHSSDVEGLAQRQVGGGRPARRRSAGRTSPATPTTRTRAGRVRVQQLADRHPRPGRCSRASSSEMITTASEPVAIAGLNVRPDTIGMPIASKNPSVAIRTSAVFMPIGSNGWQPAGVEIEAAGRLAIRHRGDHSRRTSHAVQHAAAVRAGARGTPAAPPRAG